MTERTIKYTGDSFPHGAAITLRGFSALQEIPELLLASTPTRNLEYPTDAEGARLVANHLEEVASNLGMAVDSIGYLMEVADSETNMEHIKGIGSALMAMGSLAREASDRAASMRRFANDSASA